MWSDANQCRSRVQHVCTHLNENPIEGPIWCSGLEISRTCPFIQYAARYQASCPKYILRRTFPSAFFSDVLLEHDNSDPRHQTFPAVLDLGTGILRRASVFPVALEPWQSYLHRHRQPLSKAVKEEREGTGIKGTPSKSQWSLPRWESLVAW